MKQFFSKQCLWPLAAGLLFASSARADQQCFSASVPTQTTNWSSAVAISKFDPNLGVLTSIKFTLAGSATGAAKAESLDALASTVNLNFQSTLTLTRPDNSTIVVVIPKQSFTDNFTAFDGIADFAGTSGNTHANISANATDFRISPPPNSDLLLFQGAPGNPGTITLPVKAEGTSSGNGAGNLLLQFSQAAGADVTICYNYEPRVSSFCQGDGALNGHRDCPCGNNAPSNGHGGCLNQTGLGGLLTASGVPSLTNDTFQLTITQIPVGAEAWFFEGGAASSGVDAGHGVRCLRGQIVRLQKVAVGGNVMPPPNSPPLSVMMGYQPGDIRYYQGFYRALNDLCAGPLNTTNAIRVIWGP